ncbi:hypothetical protein [Azohydromonas aeria]|uniref:hypothetical protein n=1 Tax=Azohydromonas aeria TaxID=2590212 RepID=UPI0012F8D4F3|nr:hypothetical protein [Azohydromonas aeria]
MCATALVAPGPRLATQRGIWLPLEGPLRSWLAWQARARAAAQPPRRDRSA